MFSLYSLHGYSFLKIIQIFLRTLKEFHQTRSFIKYLSRIEETILSSMVWKEDSTLWKDLQNKGFLNYEQIFPSNHLQTPTHFYSPHSPIEKVSRKLFDSTNNEEKKSSLMPIKSSPYTMFFRQLYQLIASRIGLLTRRLFSAEEREEKEEILWNFLLFLLETSLKDLLQSRDLDSFLLSSLFYLCEHSFHLSPPLTWSRLIPIYQSMPNATLKTLRSVFIAKEEHFSPILLPSTINDNPSLTPSKPAGTIHLIDGKYFGDVHTFYEQIFLKQKHLQHFFQLSKARLPFPRPPSSFSSSDQRKIKLKISSDHSIDYSSTQLQPDLSSHSQPFNPFTSQSSQQNILSSSIQAGQSRLFSPLLTSHRRSFFRNE